MKLLKTSGLESKLDDDLYEEIVKYKWWHNRVTGYAWTTINGKCVYLHRFVSGHPSQGLRTDHINEDKLDNQKFNLQHITHSENLKKKKGMGGGNTSGHRGVAPYRNKWQAYCQVDGKRKHLGVFNTIQEAVNARTFYLGL